MNDLLLKKSLGRKLVRIGLSLTAIGLSFFLFTRCGSEDLDFIEPFELSFADAFPPIVPPTIVEPPLVVKPPVPSQVVVPAVATKVTSDLQSATTNEAVDRAMEPVVPATNQFVAQTSAQNRNTLATLNANLSLATLNALRAGTATLSQNDKILLASATSFPALTPLLPALTPGTTGSRLSFTEIEIDQELKAIEENLRITDLVGPCREAVQEEYQEALSGLNSTRTTNLNTINANAATREAAIQTRFTQVNADALARFNARWVTINSYYEIYFAQKEANRLDTPEQNYLALLIYVLVNDTINAYNLDLQINNLTRLQEIADSNAIRAKAIADLTAWYNVEKTKLDNTLEAQLRRCHNQGTGN